MKMLEFIIKILNIIVKLFKDFGESTSKKKDKHYETGKKILELCEFMYDYEDCDGLHKLLHYDKPVMCNQEFHKISKIDEHKKNIIKAQKFLLINDNNVNNFIKKYVTSLNEYSKCYYELGAILIAISDLTKRYNSVGVSVDDTKKLNNYIEKNGKCMMRYQNSN